MKTLVLASSSPFRRELLKKLRLPFEHASPDIDETPQAGETPSQLVERLACAKAAALASHYSDALIIGSDQVAVGPQGQPLGKPGNEARAIEQLQGMSGKSVQFKTGLCLLDSSNGRKQSLCETYTVHFRSLTREQIQHYVTLEQPLNCAGSFKSEGLGITLFNAMEGRDPNTLIGLPLMALIDMLANVGVTLPFDTSKASV